MFQNFIHVRLIINVPEKRLKRTALDAIRTPLALGDLAEDHETLVKEFIDDTVFGFGLQIFESMLVIQLVVGVNTR